MSDNNEMTKEQMAQVMIQANHDGSNVDIRPRIAFGGWNPITYPPTWDWSNYFYRIRPEPPKPATVALTMDDVAHMVVYGGWYRRHSSWAPVEFTVFTSCHLFEKSQADAWSFSRSPITGPWYPASAVPVELLPWRNEK